LTAHETVIAFFFVAGALIPIEWQRPAPPVACRDFAGQKIVSSPHLAQTCAVMRVAPPMIALPSLRLLAPLGLTALLTSLVHASPSDLYKIPLTNIDGAPTSLAPFRGQVMLIVNVASKCGNTPQYKELESLYLKHKDEGLVVLGFPCNQFGHQEPGSNAEIKQFCSVNYAVTFPMFDKLEVNGANRHPLYAALAGPDSPYPGDIRWNFAKFLVGRDGKILQRFAPNLPPDAPEITAAIAAALKAPVPSE
jgi:glutathione peroxidase